MLFVLNDQRRAVGREVRAPEAPARGPSTAPARPAGGTEGHHPAGDVDHVGACGDDRLDVSHVRVFLQRGRLQLCLPVDAGDWAELRLFDRLLGTRRWPTQLPGARHRSGRQCRRRLRPPGHGRCRSRRATPPIPRRRWSRDRPCRPRQLRPPSSSSPTKPARASHAASTTGVGPDAFSDRLLRLACRPTYVRCACHRSGRQHRRDSGHLGLGHSGKRSSSGFRAAGGPGPNGWDGDVGITRARGPTRPDTTGTQLPRQGGEEAASDPAGCLPDGALPGDRRRTRPPPWSGSGVRAHAGLRADREGSAGHAGAAVLEQGVAVAQRVLRARKTVRVRVKLTATDSAGNATKAQRVIRVSG